MTEIFSYLLFIGKGILTTSQLLISGFLIGLLLGLLAAVMRYQGIAVLVIGRVISILRGTPLILQLAFVYFVTPGLLGIKLSVTIAGIITFGLNSSAYIAEILRAGIESIPTEQFEAARALNIPTCAMWRDIILPQVIKNILPAMINEVIALLKETALIATIGGVDLMRLAQIVAAEQFTYFMPLSIAGGYYYSLVMLIEYCGKKLEHRWQYVKY